MAKRELHRQILRMFQIAAASLLCAPVCNAAITYNYEGRWLFDSQSSLYWQALPMPAATFLPPRGELASYGQLNELVSHVGLTSGQPPAPYSIDIANFVSFFAWGSPALATKAQPDLGFSAAYSAPLPAHPELSYEFFGFEYYAAIKDRSRWSQYFSTTIGSYGPGHVCGVEYNNANCPDSVLGFVVSTTEPPPVPLPATLWLLLSGIVGLASRSRAMV